MENYTDSGSGTQGHSKIVLTTLNARYIHASFGLRYVMANMGELTPQTELLEFEINDHPLEICEEILKGRPTILGLGVYIWNATQTLAVVKLLRRIAPEVIIVLGGPEISYETEAQELFQFCHYAICGEGDVAFRLLCEQLLSGEKPPSKIIHAALPDLGKLKLPYHLYSDEDLAHRVIYVEASRGCPFTCEFCLSSLDIPVRQFPLENFLESLSDLLARGAKQFKFVDRTFNMSLKVSTAILEFFLARMSPDLFLHFEMIPDRFPEKLRTLVQKFPPGMLQFEVGIQSFNPEVGQLISRKQDVSKIEENLTFLRTNASVHIHADLIIGLPSETEDSFAAGFNKLLALHPQEIQVGVLKRLRGTPISRHDTTWEMTYDSEPPYEILKNKLISFERIQHLKRFARYWDLISNSGNFNLTKVLLWQNRPSAFHEFLNFSEWLYLKLGARHGIAFSTLAQKLFEYLTDVQGMNAELVAKSLFTDFARCDRKEVPHFLRSYEHLKIKIERSKTSAPERQAKHL